MTDTALENAVATRDEMAKKIAAAEEQIKEWRAKMQRAERFITDWEEFSGQKTQYSAASEPAPLGTARVSVSKKPRNPKKEDVAEASVEIIREKGDPMTRDELFEALKSKGINIHGKNPQVVLQTMLWRMQNRIVHLKNHGYWPREDAYMAADYVDNSAPDETEECDDALDHQPKSTI